MRTFRINDDVQKTVEHHIKTCKCFSFVTSSMNLEEKNNQEEKYIWLLTTGNIAVIKNFIRVLEEKYSNEKNYFKEKSSMKESDNHIFMKKCF